MVLLLLWRLLWRLSPQRPVYMHDEHTQLPACQQGGMGRCQVLLVQCLVSSQLQLQLQPPPQLRTSALTLMLHWQLPGQPQAVRGNAYGHLA